MSPLLADLEILSKFPKTLVQVSQNDPIRDFGLLFAIRLKKSGCPVSLREHMNVPHGILNMNSIIFELRKESNLMIMECVHFMENLDNN